MYTVFTSGPLERSTKHNVVCHPSQATELLYLCNLLWFKKQQKKSPILLDEKRKLCKSSMCVIKFPPLGFSQADCVSKLLQTAEITALCDFLFSSCGWRKYVGVGLCKLIFQHGDITAGVFTRQHVISQQPFQHPSVPTAAWWICSTFCRRKLRLWTSVPSLTLGWLRLLWNPEGGLHQMAPFPTDASSSVQVTSAGLSANVCASSCISKLVGIHGNQSPDGVCLTLLSADAESCPCPTNQAGSIHPRTPDTVG